jgi:tight adherence protein B
VNLRGLKLAVIVAALAAAVLPVAASAGSSSADAATLKVTPIERVPFPNRGYVIDLSRNVALNSGSVRVTENGKAVQDLAVTPLAGSGVGFGAVLALDASDSMQGKPFAGAIAAAKSFVAKRGTGEAIGLLAFNGGIHVLKVPTLSSAQLQRVLATPPPLVTGTRIYDAVGRALDLIAKAKLSTAAIVLLTDGTDVGSKSSLQRAIAQAQRENVRIFTIGLRSRSFDPTVLQALATKTGGAYAEATSPGQLAPIYATLSNRLAQEYLLEYSSPAKPKTQVDVQVRIRGFGTSTSRYTAPTLSGLAPYHESFMTRFLLSGFSLFLLALFVAVLIVYVIQSLLKRTESDLVQRVGAFAGGGGAAAAAPPSSSRAARRREWRARRAAAASSARGALAGLERTLEIADIQLSAPAVVGFTIVGTVLAIIILAVISPVVAVLGLLTPFLSKALIRRKLKKVRSDFAEQLPSNLQVLASALRSGYSFTAALTTVVDQAGEPTQRELRRVLADDQLGVPMDEALRRVAKRMKSRDLEQVALVAELQLTTGGNVAEVLDVVVGTIRDRQDVRRLLRTLTAQGRMARWVLTGLPIVTGLFFYAYQPDIVGPFYGRLAGQIVLVLAVILVASGSLVIQRIIDIEV